MLPLDAVRPRALLVVPPIYDFAAYDQYVKPFGLLRIGAALGAAGWDTTLVDALDCHDAASDAALGTPRRSPDGTGHFYREPLAGFRFAKDLGRRYARYGIVHESFAARIGAAAGGRGFEAVFISSGMTYWYRGVVEAVETVRAIIPGVPVVIGGIYASLLPRHCRDVTGADLVVRGEGTTAADTLPEGGLGPFLERRGLPVPSFPAPDPKADPAVWHEAGVLRLNAGCPYDCAYCASRELTGGFAPGSAEAAFAWFERLYRDCGTRNFAFYDDALLACKESVLVPFLARVIAGGFAASFYTPNAVHVNLIDPETAHLMRRAGFREVRLGFESSSGSFHDAYDGKTGIGRFRDAVDTLAGAGFEPRHIRAYVLAGLPGQRAGEVEDSVREAAGAGTAVSIAEYTPVPGTALWEESVRRSHLPIAEDPVYQNNCFFPLEWEGFTRADLARLKLLERCVAGSRSSSGSARSP